MDDNVIFLRSMPLIRWHLSSYSVCSAVPAHTWTDIITKGNMERLKHIFHQKKKLYFIGVLGRGNEFHRKLRVRKFT